MPEKELLEKIHDIDAMLFELFDTAYQKNSLTEKEISKIFLINSSGVANFIQNEKILLALMKKNLDAGININDFLDKKEFEKIKVSLVITTKELVDIFSQVKILARQEFLNSSTVKKMIFDVRGELPIASARIYNISLGLLTKADGTEVTLKEYSELTGEDFGTLKNILESAKNIVEKKVNRRLGLLNA